jgi:hypothetical protein
MTGLALERLHDRTESYDTLQPRRNHFSSQYTIELTRSIDMLGEYV